MTNCHPFVVRRIRIALGENNPKEFESLRSELFVTLLASSEQLEFVSDRCGHRSAHINADQAPAEDARTPSEVLQTQQNRRAGSYLNGSAAAKKIKLGRERRLFTFHFLLSSAGTLCSASRPPEIARPRALKQEINLCPNLKLFCAKCHPKSINTNWCSPCAGTGDGVRLCDRLISVSSLAFADSGDRLL